MEKDRDHFEKDMTCQFTAKLDAIIKPFFPRNTRRGEIYGLGMQGARTLLNEGPRPFRHLLAQYIHRIREAGKYQRWIQSSEPSAADFDQLRELSRTFRYQPKISIITPVWNVDEQWLRLATGSVLNQVYGNWELCIADGASEKPYLKPFLTELALKESRVRVVFLPENLGIAGNSNEALSLATGDFVGFLDHDDELSPDALYEVVKLLNENQGLDFIYSDEDKIDGKERRRNPFFKPDWSPDLLLSQNYINHLLVIRKSLINQVKGFREGYPGSQDYDLCLRVTEQVPETSIAHIPKILYHWRVVAGSAADDPDAKPYAHISAKKALQDALVRRGTAGEVLDGIFPRSIRVRYALTGTPRISIIIPSRDHVAQLRRCIQSILQKTWYPNYDIILVDNQSREEATWDYYASLGGNPRITVLQYDAPFNFSAINNFAAAHTGSPFMVFLNNDTEVISGEWLSALLEHAQRDRVGAVGAKLLYPDNTLQHAGVILGITGTPGQKGVAGHSHKRLPNSYQGYFLRPHLVCNYSAVTAACLMVRRDVFEEVGGFNEDIAVAFNDVDFCLKIRKRGYLIVYTPYAALYHHESFSRGRDTTPESRLRFRREVELVRSLWGETIDKGDPYYNRNLTLTKQDFSLK